MTYATAQDMIDRFGERQMRQLTDVREPRLDAVNMAVLGTALDDASAEIDGYLAGVVALPLASTPEMLRVICVDLARYRLQHTTADEQVVQRVEAAREYLMAVAAGKVKLTLPGGADVPAPGAGTVVFDTGSKVMGRSSYD